MAQKVRVRFAPSPTGPLHIGGVRTALFNYLFAKKHNGSFILRIEDTDQNRYVEGAEEYIVEALNWLNIPFDEGPGKEGGFGPYRQSERKEIYQKYADELVASGKAYIAFDTPEELDTHRKEHESQGKTFIYNWHNREKLNNSLVLSEEETKARMANGDPYVIRFKSPQDETILLQDIIRGTISINSNTLDDKVLFKSDGMPTYHLANIVDDHLMEISHVIRGEEWLPSLALHKMLYDAFGWNSPEFAHLPLIMKPVGKGKLSKRDGQKLGFPVFPMEWHPEGGESYSGYREDGYLPEAVVNMLALLGWNPGTEQEIFSLDELVQAFELEKVHKGGAKFDPEKTRWFQHHYLQQLSDETIAHLFKSEVLIPRGISVDHIDVQAIVSSLKERVTFVADLWEQGSFFFVAPSEYDEKASKKAFKEDTAEVLRQVVELISEMDDFSSELISEKIKGWITSRDMGFGKVMMPLRLALVGEMKGPDVFEIAALLGKGETIRRIEAAIQFMS
jgi:glutamyl-tRNA synthetase